MTYLKIILPIDLKISLSNHSSGFDLQVFVDGVDSKIFWLAQDALNAIFSQFTDNKFLFENKLFSNDFIENLLCIIRL